MRGRKDDLPRIPMCTADRGGLDGFHVCVVLFSLAWPPESDKFKYDTSHPHAAGFILPVSSSVKWDGYCHYFLKFL